MAQHDYGNPQSPFSGTQLNTTLRNWRDALHTLHRGASRPSYVQGGMLWVREVSSTNWELTFYDGADDILVATINPATNTITPAGAATPADLQTRVAKAGDTMTGLLTLSGAPTASNHAATKAYVDARVAKAGDTMTGNLTIDKANPELRLRSDTPSTRVVRFQTGSQDRFLFGVSATSEGGSDTGSNAFLNRVLDNGTQSSVLVVERNTGRVRIEGTVPLRLPGVDPQHADDAVPKQYVDAIIGGSGRRLTGVYVFNSTQNWTRPTGTTAMLVWAVGGGGGGGQGWESGGGGGGGEQP